MRAARPDCPSRRGAFLLALATALAFSPGPGGAAAAQAPVQPGGIATVLATAAVPPELDSVGFRLEAAPDVRVFGRTAGVWAADPDGSIRVPFTFGLPPSAGAGSFRLGRLHLTWPRGHDSVDVAVEVAARRGATFWVGAESVTAVPGTPLEVGYRLRNRGNAVDSFSVTAHAPRGWTVRSAPAVVVVAPGDTAAGAIRLVPPATAPAGQEHLVRVELSAADVRELRTFQVAVVADGGWLGDLAHIPGTLFVGSSSGSGSPGVALQAAGEVRPGTRFSAALRHSDLRDVAPALRGALAGPRVRLGLEARGWKLRLGDVFTPAGILGGPVSQGRGAEVGIRHRDAAASVFVAAPLTHGLKEESGLIVQAAGSLETPAGRFGVKVARVRRQSSLFGLAGREGATATWDLDRPGHDLSLEAGILAISADSAADAGFAGQARYMYTSEAGSVTARFRKVPAGARGSANETDEAFLSGTLRISPRASLAGWSFASAAPFADGGAYAVSRGGAAGVRGLLPGDVQGELLGSYRENHMVGDTLPARITRSVRASLDVPAGPFALELAAELGTASSGATRPYRQLRTGARWSAHRQWAWLGVYHSDAGVGPPASGLDLAGALLVRQVELQGGLNLRLPGRGSPATTSFWSGAHVPLTREITITIGADHRPRDPTMPWRFSLGASRAFGLPLPLGRHPVLHGIVFEDLDGDRTRDPNEPVLQGVVLQLGPLHAITNAEGEFRFHERVPGELRVGPGALPPGYIVAPQTHLPTAGRAEIPVMRAATVELHLFLDRDGNGERDALDQAAATIAVSLQDPAGRTRDAATDAAGRVRFSGLPPGPYTLLIHSTPADRAGSEPLELHITLDPGSTLTRAIAVPFRRRQIRIRDDAAPSPGPAAAPPAAPPSARP